MKSKQALVPKLRFGEFEEIWKLFHLEDLVEFFNGKAHEQSISKNGEFVVVNSKFISTAGRVQKYTDTLIFPLYKRDVVMVMSDVPNGKALAKCYHIERSNTYSLNQRICALRSKTTSSDRFIFYRINRNEYYLRFDSGVGQTNLRKDQVLKCPIAAPSLPEQEKIAAFLTSVDDRIDQLKRKKSLLQDYKKGAMQKLFSQELRFKDEQGKDFPDWEEKKLGDAIESTVSGASLKPSDFCFNGNHPVFPKKYISSGGKLSDNAETTYCTDEFFAINPSSTIDSSYLITTLRDLVPSGPSIGYIVSYDSGIIYMLAQGVYGLKIVEWVSNKGFLIQYSNTQIFRKWMRKIKVGSTQVHIRTNEYKAVPFRRPSLPEQTKIANFLSSLDQKLEQIDTQITQTQSFKKGLLQQMFV